MTWGTHAEDNETAVTTFDDMMSGWFKYVQTEDGSIPAIFHAKGEDISSKKALQQLSKPTLRAQVAKLRLIYSQFIFQNIRKRHTFYSLYTTMCSFNNNGRYEASAQDREDGVQRMHRSVKSKDVEDYASHMPGDVVALDREEDIEYRRGFLTHSSGISKVKLMPQV